MAHKGHLMSDLSARVDAMRAKAPRTLPYQPEPSPDPTSEGMAVAAESTGDEWGDRALAVIEHHLKLNPYLHVSLLWAPEGHARHPNDGYLPELPDGVIHGKALGVAISRAKSRKWMEKYELSVPGWDGPPVYAAVETTVSRGGLKPLWKSNLYLNGRNQ